MTKAVEHLFQAEEHLRKATAAAAGEPFDRWVKLANAHCQLAIAYKQITTPTKVK